MPHSRGGSRAAATSKMERFMRIVNSWKPLTILKKRSILHVAAALDLTPYFNDVKYYVAVTSDYWEAFK